MLCSFSHNKKFGDQKMKKITLACLAFTIVGGMAVSAVADSLKNLERERALAIAALLDSTIDIEARWNKLNLSKARLADLEVMVINDKSLKNSYSPRVKHALSNYELTFLAHASVEDSKSIAAHWFEHIGLSTDQLMASRLAK
jgi:hypothetical protein